MSPSISRTMKQRNSRENYVQECEFNFTISGRKWREKVKAIHSVITIVIVWWNELISKLTIDHILIYHKNSRKETSKWWIPWECRIFQRSIQRLWWFKYSELYQTFLRASFDFFLCALALSMQLILSRDWYWTSSMSIFLLFHFNAENKRTASKFSWRLS